MALDSTVAQTSVDFAGLNQLRLSANQSEQDPDTLRQVAAQFESLFISMMLKSMRDASLGEGIFDSEQSDMYQDFADQQLAIDLSRRGGLGLQDVIIRQLGGDPTAMQPAQVGQAFAADTITTRAVLPALVERVKELSQSAEKSTDLVKPQTGNNDLSLPQQFNSPAEFVSGVWPMAQQAAAEIGVQPEVLVAQAALETGWGRYIIENEQGSSFNLFNIKADNRWSGDYVSKNVLEYRDGVAIREQSRFRAYSDYQQSFADYVQFLQSNPRYSEALANTEDANKFVEKLHQAGYATDPAYADKIKRIMHGDTLAQNSQVFRQ